MAEKMTLLPCPFCGSTDVETYPADRERSRWNVCCGNPGCVTRGDNDYLTQADSVAAWNRRHIAQPAQAVDVGEIREVIAYLQVGHRFDVDMADKLTRAIGNAQADD